MQPPASAWRLPISQQMLQGAVSRQVLQVRWMLRQPLALERQAQQQALQPLAASAQKLKLRRPYRQPARAEIFSRLHLMGRTKTRACCMQRVPCDPVDWQEFPDVTIDSARELFHIQEEQAPCRRPGAYLGTPFLFITSEPDDEILSR